MFLSASLSTTPSRVAWFRQLVSESSDNETDDGSADGPHADDWRVGFSDNGVWDTQ